MYIFFTSHLAVKSFQASSPSRTNINTHMACKVYTRAACEDSHPRAHAHPTTVAHAHLTHTRTHTRMSLRIPPLTRAPSHTHTLAGFGGAKVQTDAIARAAPDTRTGRRAR